jgi:hypothetical protein
MGLFLIALAVALAALVWALLQRRHDQPTYQGRTLRQWLITAMDYRYDEGGAARAKAVQATNAVHRIGTDALPWLVKGLDCEIPKWRDNLFDALPRQTFTHPRLARPLIGPEGTRFLLSVTGFEILGEEAAPAVPALMALAGDWQSKDRAGGVLIALTYLGNGGSTSLVWVVTNSTIPVRHRITAARSLTLRPSGPRTNLTWAIPALARCAGETEISNAVAETLAALAKQSPTVVPKLLEACSSDDATARQGATNALGLIAPELLKKDP